MKLKVVLMLSVAMTVSTLHFAVAQQNETRRIPTVEELFISAPDMGATIEQAASSDRDTKMVALDDIEAMIDEGRTSGNDGVIGDLLWRLSAEGTFTTVRESGRLVNNYPVIRRRAVELMGRLARDSTDEKVVKEAKVNIVDVLLKDKEVMVKSEAAYAIGFFDMDEDEQKDALSMLYEMIHRQSAAGPDNNFAYAVALSIENIAERSKGINDYRGYTALVTIMQGNYTRKVKDKAFEVLQKLKEYREN